MNRQSSITQSTSSATLVDILERVLDKGVVIAGDIKIKLVDIELLSIQIRLVICSVDRATDMGMDWWKNGNSFLSNNSAQTDENFQKTLSTEIGRLHDRLADLEKRLPQLSVPTETAASVAG